MTLTFRERNFSGQIILPYKNSVRLWKIRSLGSGFSPQPSRVDARRNGDNFSRHSEGQSRTRAAESPIASVHLSVKYFAKISEGVWLEVRSRLDRKGKRLLFLSSTVSLTIKLRFVFVQEAKMWPDFSCVQLTACFKSAAAANARNLDKKIDLGSID
jgi:hypothetical protein